MKTLTDKAFSYRTYPVAPRKRVKFDLSAPVEYSTLGSDQPVFRCQGGYLSHHSYNLMDFFVSRWAHIISEKLERINGYQHSKSLSASNFEILAGMNPLLKKGEKYLVNLETNLVEVSRHLRDFAQIESIGDSEMRRHPSLAQLSSAALNEVIARTASIRIKTIYPVRVLRVKGQQRYFGWVNISNLADSADWSGLYAYRMLDEKKGADGRVNERFYRFGFNSLLGLAMIHNTFCGGSWSVNPKLYELSGDAQLLYRYVVISGSRMVNNRTDYIGQRIGLRERQKRRLAGMVESLLKELQMAELIENVKISLNAKRNYLCSFQIAKSKCETLRDNAKDNDQVESCDNRSVSQNNQSKS
jgi:hypothetical protein